MFSTLSNLPAVNTYVSAAIAIAVAYTAFSAGRSAYRNVGRNVWLRYIRWAACALLTALLVSALTAGRWVPADHVGVSKNRVYPPGWHVYPREPFVTLTRAGMFCIPYPDDRRFLEVTYLITDSDRLRLFSEEILFCLGLLSGMLGRFLAIRSLHGSPGELVSISRLSSLRIRILRDILQPLPVTEFLVMQGSSFNNGVRGGRKEWEWNPLLFSQGSHIRGTSSPSFLEQRVREPRGTA